MNIHEKIRLLRETKNWSQEDMAEKLSMSVNGYSKIERGETKPYNPKLEKIAEVFGVDLLELISAKDKNVYLISDNTNNNVCNVIGSSSEIALEMQKLQMMITHKDETIKQLRIEIELLKDVITLIKNQ